MLITTEQLSRFSGVYPEDDDLQTIYINSAMQKISDYVGYNPEECEDFKIEIYTEEGTTTEIKVPDIFKLVCLEIATLIQAEEGSNIGVNTQSEVGVNRTFLNVVDYSKYLDRLSSFRKV